MAYIRRHREIITELLYYTLYIVVVICAFWLLGSSHAVLAEYFGGIRDEVNLTLDSIASILGIAAAALAIIISNRQQAYKERQATRCQTYQQLELESINLFRFEIDNVELARIIWDNEVIGYDDLQKDHNQAYRVLQHICQVLNLFEMAVRFKRDGIAHEDVFNSWEVWIFDLCKSDVFLHYWYLEGLKENYIQLFQDIIDDGLVCCHGKKQVDAVIAKRDDSEDEQLQEFGVLIKQRLAAH